MPSARRLVMFAAFVGPLAWTTVALADPPCLLDIQKFCANAAAGQGGIQACLKSHETDLSPDCKGHIDGLRKTAKHLATVCIWDIERFCGSVAPGGGRIVACLKQNKDDLSPLCQAEFAKAAHH